MDSNIEKLAKRLNEALEMAESMVKGVDEAILISAKGMADAGEPNLTPEHRALLGQWASANARLTALLDVQQMLADEVGIRVAVQSYEKT